MSIDHPLIEQAALFAREIAPRSAEIEAAGRVPADLSARMGAAGLASF